MPSVPTAGLAPPSFSRRDCLEKFDDGGLTTGPRNIFIYLPDGYDTSPDRYAVMYFNDGGNMLSGPGARMDVDLAHDRLVNDGLIEPTIFVGLGIINVPSRIKALTPTADDGKEGAGGGLHGYYRFISERLKPYIDSHYRTKTEPASTGIAGYSLGGLAAFLLAYEHPETFGMAGCMSSSLYWDHEYAFSLVKSDSGRKMPIRFWLDCEGGAYDGWPQAVRIYSLLEQRGWHAGDDLAAYFDYPEDHRFEAGAARMRDMLYFLLRRKPLKFKEYRLVNTSDPTAPTVDFNIGRRRIVGAEAWYENGLRLTAPEPSISVDNPCVATVDSDDHLLLQGSGPGETTITSTYSGHTSSLQVIGYHKEPSSNFLACPQVTILPGFGKAWTDLPYTIPDETENVVARFGVAYDDRHVHISVRVWDGAIVSGQDTLPGNQDSIGFIFDGRAASVLFRGKGYGDNDDDHALILCASPAEPGKEIGIGSRGVRLDPLGSEAWNRVMPSGSDVACQLTPDGYQGRLSIPASHLDQLQDGSWRAFRLNIWINNADTAGGPVTETWWQPEWKKFHSLIWAGIFARR
jgi:predicted alpha/beta superfamily hydrolase